MKIIPAMIGTLAQIKAQREEFEENTTNAPQPYYRILF
jgi:hypothetical protein